MLLEPWMLGCFRATILGRYVLLPVLELFCRLTIDQIKAGSKHNFIVWNWQQAILCFSLVPDTCPGKKGEKSWELITNVA